jgi:XTP/dITP diphosphohydrolase
MPSPPPRLDRLVLATGNPGKLAEMRTLLAPLGIQVLAPKEAGWTAGVAEDGDTLEANALIKARAASAATGLPAVADDSGLFVDALEGAPGVHSARFAGPAQDAAANCAKLVEALAGEERRGASFRCAVALVVPGGPEAVFEGRCDGRIALEPRGRGGFGYDPLFVVGGETRTFAELPPEEKHRHSHRGRALGALRAYLETGVKETS